MATATAKREIKRVIDPGLLDAEDQAALTERQMEVRGGVKVLDGRLTQLRGKLMRANAQINPERMKACLVDLRDELNRVIADVDRLAS